MMNAGDLWLVWCTSSSLGLSLWIDFTDPQLLVKVAWECYLQEHRPSHFEVKSVGVRGESFLEVVFAHLIVFSPVLLMSQMVKMNKWPKDKAVLE